VKGEDEIRDQLVHELAHARRRAAELERLESLRQRAEEELRSRTRQRAAVGVAGAMALAARGLAEGGGRSRA
jgi:hypothetical protein